MPHVYYRRAFVGAEHAIVRETVVWAKSTVPEPNCGRVIATATGRDEIWGYTARTIDDGEKARDDGNRKVPRGTPLRVRPRRWTRWIYYPVTGGDRYGARTQTRRQDADIGSSQRLCVARFFDMTCSTSSLPSDQEFTLKRQLSSTSATTRYKLARCS